MVRKDRYIITIKKRVIGVGRARRLKYKCTIDLQFDQE